MNYYDSNLLLFNKVRLLVIEESVLLGLKTIWKAWRLRAERGAAARLAISVQEGVTVDLAVASLDAGEALEEVSDLSWLAGCGSCLKPWEDAKSRRMSRIWARTASVLAKRYSISVLMASYLGGKAVTFARVFVMLAIIGSV